MKPAAARAMTAPGASPRPLATGQSEPDMRLADCGGTTFPGWQLGWSQVIGRRHARLSEDSLAHGSRVLPGREPGSAQALCLAVADGVGGGARGEIASAALASHCVALPNQLLGRAGAIVQWMLLAEGQVQLKLREVSYAPGAATLAAAWLLPAQSDDGAYGVYGHILRVGDARLYHFDGTHLAPLTRDQTYASVGESPPEGATEDDPARMVGTGFTGQPEVSPVQLAAGDTLLLCSDGLHRGLATEHMAELLRQGGEPSACALRLGQAARRAGSDDDITVLLAHVPQPQRPTTSEYSGLMGRLRKLF
jgi:serine/threonine protein phosphatase PrpC